MEDVNLDLNTTGAFTMWFRIYPNFRFTLLTLLLATCSNESYLLAFNALLETGIQITIYDLYFLLESTYDFSSKSILKEMLDNFSKNSINNINDSLDKDDNKILHLLNKSHNKHVIEEVLDFILKSGAEVNAKNANGDTIAHLASHKNYSFILS